MYSQVYQDEFAAKLIGSAGFFVDVGAGDGYNRPNGGNSQYLEELGWKGILIEGNEQFHQYSKLNRKSISVHAFIPSIKIIDILKNNNCPNVIDYLSIDIEPSSLVALKDFPFDEYEFKVLTFEHDSYRFGISDKTDSWKILSENGYICLCEDVETPQLAGPYEDWWINPKYFTPNFIEKNKSKGLKGQEIVNGIIDC
jgi:hypothetical protein